MLYRTNSQSRQIEEALRRYGRKYIVVGGFSFYQRAEVKDVIAYLKALVSPQDSISLLRIINTPARGIGRTTIEQIEQYALQHELTIWTAIERMLHERAFPARAEAALAGFHRMMQQLIDGIETRPAVETLRAVLEQTGYRNALQEENTPEAQSRLGNLDELLNAASDAAERGESLRDFLDHAALVADADSLDERAPVSLLTMHNAKGLEFPIVFIAGMEEGLFPHSRSIDTDASMEEERRLCYVAMTRAEKRLYLSWARYRRRFGGGQPEASIRSRFLQEVPPALIEKARGQSGQVDLYAEQHRSAKPPAGTFILGRLTTRSRTSVSSLPRRGTPAPSGLAAVGPQKKAPEAPAKPVADAKEENWTGIDRRACQVRPRHHACAWKVRATIPK